MTLSPFRKWEIELERTPIEREAAHLFMYTASIEREPREGGPTPDSSDSEEESRLWRARLSDDDDSSLSSIPKEEPEDEKSDNDEGQLNFDGIDEVVDSTPVPTPAVTAVENRNHGAPLSPEEMALFREYIRTKINRINPKENDKSVEKQRSFKVPKDHPVFDGQPENLDKFIFDMKLGHARWTTGDAAQQDNPDFICQLVTYFKVDTPTRRWFQLYVMDRRRLKKKLSWNKLVTKLRKDYSVFNRPGVLFKRYWDLKQNKLPIHSYITEKKSAALLVKTELSDDIILFGFIEGLRPDLRKYVTLQKPKTIVQAQKHALLFEESLIDLDLTPAVNVNRKPDKRKRSDEPKANDTKNDMTSTQKKALQDLRTLRKDRCFKCGSKQHRENCDATSVVRDGHQKEISRLKGVINAKE
jgi:hypothetical protein